MFLVTFAFVGVVAIDHAAARGATAARGFGGGGEATTANEERGREGKERLVFGGALDLRSDPLPPGATRASLVRFFDEEKESNVALIASAGRDRPAERIPRTAELDGYWRECCDDAYGVENSPEEEDPVYRTDVTWRFPGMLELATTTYNGVKAFAPGADDGEEAMPKYVTNMIAEAQHPKGLPPIVWAFRKICGFCVREGSLRPCGRVQTTMSVVSVDDDDDDDDERRGTGGGGERRGQRYAFSFSVDIRIRLEFPRRLLRFMPMKKDKAEALVSKVMLKALSKDLERTLRAFRDKFLTWHADGSSEEDGGDDVDGTRSEL